MAQPAVYQRQRKRKQHIATLRHQKCALSQAIQGWFLYLCAQSV